MPRKKQSKKKRPTAIGPSKKRLRPRRALLDYRSILVDLIRNVCYRYGLAMARYEFKGKTPKPSIDEFRERIAHHIGLMEASLKEKTSKEPRRPLERASEMLSIRLRLDVERIRNGLNTEVEAVYDSLR